MGANRMSDSFMLQYLQVVSWDQLFVLHAPYHLAGRSDMRPQGTDLKIALGPSRPAKAPWKCNPKVDGQVR